MSKNDEFLSKKRLFFTKNKENYLKKKFGFDKNLHKIF